MENTGKNDGYDEIVLLDENGEEASFVHVLTFVYEGQKYVALEPVEQQDDEEAEVVLLKVDTKDGQDYYNTIDNEILLNEVFNEFLDIVEEMEGEDEIEYSLLKLSLSSSTLPSLLLYGLLIDD